MFLKKELFQNIGVEAKATVNCEKCGKKVSFLYASKQKKKEDVIFCENCKKEYNKKIEQIEEEKRKHNDPLKDFILSKSPEPTLEQTIFRMALKGFQKCDKCDNFFKTIRVFSFGEKEYCMTCLGEILKERKTPYAFLETIGQHIVENRTINSKSITLVTLGKNNGISTTTNTASNGEIPFGFASTILDRITESGLYEKLKKEKDELDKKR
jgi:hypothetical protein